VTPRYLLDTNVLSDLVRHPGGVIRDRISAAGESVVCTSIVVSAALRFGAMKSGSARLVDRVDIILSAMEVLPLEPPVDRHYASLRRHLELAGNPIGPNDLLIAAHALATNLCVVTANTREFSKVPNLPVENWLAP